MSRSQEESHPHGLVSKAAAQGNVTSKPPHTQNQTIGLCEKRLCDLAGIVGMVLAVPIRRHDSHTVRERTQDEVHARLQGRTLANIHIMPKNMHLRHASHRLKARIVLGLAPVVDDDNRRVGLLGNDFDEINKRPSGAERGNQNCQIHTTDFCILIHAGHRAGSRRFRCVTTRAKGRKVGSTLGKPLDCC